MVAIEKFFSDRADWHQGEQVNPLVRQYQRTLDSLLGSDDKLKRCVKYCLDCGIRFLAAPQNAGREDLRCPFGCAKRHRARQSNERVKAYRGTETGKKKKDALNAKRYRSPSTACESPHEDELAVRHASGGRLQASASTTPRPREPAASTTRRPCEPAALTTPRPRERAASTTRRPCEPAAPTTSRPREPAASTTPWPCEPAALTTPRSREPAASTTPRPCEPAAPTTPRPCELAASADSPLAKNATQPLPAELSVAVELDLDGVILDESSVVQSPMLPYIRTLIGMIDGIRLSHVEVAEWLVEVLRQRSMARRPRRDYVLRFLHQHPP